MTREIAEYLNAVGSATPAQNNVLRPPTTACHNRPVSTDGHPGHSVVPRAQRRPSPLTRFQLETVNTHVHARLPAT